MKYSSKQNVNYSVNDAYISLCRETKRVQVQEIVIHVYNI